MASVSARNIVKAYGEVKVIEDLSLEIEDGRFVVLLGPSGCGKSTLLRMIAGLEPISGGTVRIGDRVVNDVHPKDRNIAMVFQNYALYAHMTVRENMGFALELRRETKAEIDRKIQWAASILNLGDYLDRYPRQLSGGQRQRVAMGRAIVRDPAVFLFDEPLSNLDAKLRVQMRTEIKALHQRLTTTTVYVTHDQIEAMTMADVIVIMRSGVIEQIGAPLAVYDRPANLFVAEFIGSPAMNLLRGVVEAREGRPMLRTKGGASVAIPDRPGLAPGREVVFGVRPEHLGIAAGAGEGTIAATVEVVEPTGPEIHVYCEFEDVELCAITSQRLEFRPGAPIGLLPDLARAHLFDARTGLIV
jgi:multiple sugar transport system ATP-binding protein